MAVEVLKKRTFSAKLDNGRDSEGNVRTVSISMGSVNKDRWDNEKALNIAGALEPCLSKDISALESTATYGISAGE